MVLPVRQREAIVQPDPEEEIKRGIRYVYEKCKGDLGFLQSKLAQKLEQERVKYLPGRSLYPLTLEKLVNAMDLFIDIGKGNSTPLDIPRLYYLVHFQELLEKEDSIPKSLLAAMKRDYKQTRAITMVWRTSLLEKQLAQQLTNFYVKNKSQLVELNKNGTYEMSTAASSVLSKFERISGLQANYQVDCQKMRGWIQGRLDFDDPLAILSELRSLTSNYTVGGYSNAINQMCNEYETKIYPTLFELKEQYVLNKKLAEVSIP